MEFPSNSNKDTGKPAKTKKEKIEKVTTGMVVVKKPPLSQKFKSIFFGGEFKSTSQFVFADVLIPAIRKLIVDSIINGVENVVYGPSASQRRRGAADYRPRIQYNSPLVRQDPRERTGILPGQAPQPRGSKSSEQLLLTTKEEAELVVQAMSDILDTYDVVSIADLYDIVGLPSSHIDHKWGWGTVAGVSIRQTRDGYLIEFPPMEPIQS